MAIRKIHEVGDPCLAKVCRPVTEFNDRLHELLDDMADTLEEAGGVGLAAPQVGILRRVCIVEDEQGEIIELINPEIIKTEGEQTGLEGCLSVPGRQGFVYRPQKVTVRAQDRHGKVFELTGEDLLARALCATQKMLLLDEPVSGLDPKVTAEMYTLIEKLNREDGITVIMISHDVAAAVRYASHILHIGDTVFFGTKADYLQSPQGRLFDVKKGGDSQ